MDSKNKVECIDIDSSNDSVVFVAEYQTGNLKQYNF